MSYLLATIVAGIAFAALVEPQLAEAIERVVMVANLLGGLG